MCDAADTPSDDSHSNGDNCPVGNNNCESPQGPALLHHQPFLKRPSKTPTEHYQLGNYFKASIWGSPNSGRATVTRRSHSVGNIDFEPNVPVTLTKRQSSTKNNVSSKCHGGTSDGQIRRQTIHVVSGQSSLFIGLSSSWPLKAPSLSSSANMQKSSRNNCNSANNKEKPHKLRLSKNSDRNANSTSTSPTTANPNGSSNTCLAQGGTVRKTSTKHSKYFNEETSTSRTEYEDGNYMEFEFFSRDVPGREATHFTELFRDFPVSYETTPLPVNTTTSASPQPPPYRDPPPPTPPPLSQLPSRNLRNSDASGVQSCPSSPFRGKVVLSKKERKELSKLAKLQDNITSNSTSNLRGLEICEPGTHSSHTSPYRGRVTELKNCIARINSKGIFASLHRSSQKSLNAQQQQAEEQTVSTEVSPPPPAPDGSPPGSNASNNNDADYTEKLKNLPVRQRKAHTSHMDNYCLFDPMDFVNEKTLRRRTHEALDMDLPLQQQQHGLRDPLFSSRQNLDFSEEELVPEVIYDDEIEREPKKKTHNFDHHNYFVIDPEDFEDEPPAADIGIPNPYTNEQIVQANLMSTQHTYVNNTDNLGTSESLEKLLNAFDAAPSMSNSQESKDTTTTNSTTTTTSTALVESSTSTNSNTSSTSNTSSQTTLQRTKKKLTFLNLSPFRSQKPDKSDHKKHKSGDHTHLQQQEQRAVSELLSSEHMIHLQHMLLSADNVLKDVRSHNETIELNYVLFNPGPVPSRNVQYKIRKPRPLSTHSDADSGFLSPCSPDEFTSMKSNPALLVLQQCDSVQGYIEIYTDWANYYLERAKSKKKVTDLSSDCRDGLLLAEVIEAVTSFKVPDLHKKPKNQQQMFTGKPLRTAVDPAVGFPVPPFAIDLALKLLFPFPSNAQSKCI